MTRSVWLGQSVRLATPVLDGDNGDPATVPGVDFRIYKPDATTTTVAGAFDAASGEWRAIVSASQVGRWRVEAETMGGLVGVDVEWFEVKARDAV